MASWELAPRLAAKYPWLRVDSSTIGEFRAPFDWGRASSSSSCSSSSSTGSTGVRKQEKVRAHGVSGRHRAPISNAGEVKLKKKAGNSHGKPNGRRLAAGERDRRRQRRTETPTIASQNQDVPYTDKSGMEQRVTTRLPPAPRDAVSPACGRGPIQPATAEPKVLAMDSPLWLTVKADFEAAIKPKRRQKQHKVGKTRLQALSLQLPALQPKQVAGGKTRASAHAQQQLQQYTKELEVLQKDEERLKIDVAARIEAERAKLPLTFLFQRNLELRSYCKEKGVATITQIFAKLQHRMLFSAFERWHNVFEVARKEERKRIVFQESQARAIKLFERLASDAYVGTIERAFQMWHAVARAIVVAERNRAAAVIQGQFRKRRAVALASVLKQASLDADYKRKIEIQQLLRFESYGTTMLWSTLRLGFNMVIQNHCARRVQFFFRRLVVQKRVDRRIARRQAATKIETQWRMHLARADVAKKRVEAARRRAQEERAATLIQCQARRITARKQLENLRMVQKRKNEAAARLQCWWHKCKSRWALQERFSARKRMLEEEQERLDRLRRLEVEELRRQDAALTIQRVARGWIGRHECRHRRYAKRLDSAARRVQASWRMSKGRYALHLRFVAQGTRLEERREAAALEIQCCYRRYVAKATLYKLRHEQNRRRVAAIIIQRSIRRHFAQKRYRHKRRSAVVVQTGMRSKLAKLQRQRLLLERERKRQATLRIQCWARSVAARMLVKALRTKQRQDKERRRQSALLIQKRARGVEVRKMVSLLKDAIAIVELEQSRHRKASHQQNSSELLDFVTKHYFSNPETIGAKRFTALEFDWLLNQVNQSKEQMKIEDRAIVFLQRYYRGYVSRAAFWVMKVQQQQQRQREQCAAVQIQRVSRGFLARRSVRRRRQQRKMEQLKATYIQERRWKEQEQQWQEQYQREQLEIQIRRAKQLEVKLIHAKREAELAKFQAEAAMYRRQEQQLLKEQESERKKQPPDSTEGDKHRSSVSSQWDRVTDEYGSAYYFNAQTGESRWDLPPEDIDPDETKLAKDKQLEENSTQATKADTKQFQAGIDKQAKDNKSGQEIASQDEAAGKCVVCRSAQASKQCVDCGSGAKSSLYCVSCFAEEHFGALAAPTKRTHDFKVLVKSEVRSRCQSHLGCGDAASLKERQLATYFCYECHSSSTSKEDAAQASTPDSTTAADPPKTRDSSVNFDTRGCFFCDECFTQAHETALEMQHATSALHFKTGAHLCCGCKAVVALRLCEQCDERYCSKCFDRIHSNSRVKREHIFSPIEIVKEELSSDKDAYCIECDVRRSDRLCNLCGDGFCERCFAHTHAKGTKQGHTWIPWSSFAQVGDWLEIWDEKANAKIFFNLETKESTTKQPFVLKPATERHQLQLAEREQLHKRRELELESELVKLKEQLRDMEEKETKAAQRPLSRGLVPGGGVPTTDLESNKTPSDGKKPKKKKQGMISRLLTRSSKTANVEEKELTEGEKKRKQLVEGVQDAERDLIVSRMKTRAREEKEAKAKETIGTALFQQTMVQELAQPRLQATGHFDEARTSSSRVSDLRDAMDSERSPPASDVEDEPARVTRTSTSRRASTLDAAPTERGEHPNPGDCSEPCESIFEAEDVAIDIIDDTIIASVAESLETFYHERLVGYVADSVARMAFEAMAPVFATRELATSRRDPLQDVVFPSAIRPVEGKPFRSGVDSHSKSEIPVRKWRRQSEAYYGSSPSHSRHSSPSQTPRSMGRGERYDSPTASRPSSLSSFKQRKKRPNTGGHGGAVHSTVDGGSACPAIAPGVVFSTAPPERLPQPSPRKAMALLRCAKRLSTSSPKAAPHPVPGEAVEGDADEGGDDCSSEERESSVGDGEDLSVRRRRFSIDIMNPHAAADLLQGDGESESAPVDVEYSIKRQSPGRVTSTTLLPELAASGSVLAREGIDPSEDAGFVVDAAMQGFHGMMLSPGVKLQAGETTKAGPELPLFVTRMRKSTFNHIDALSLSAASSTQSLQTPKQLPATPRRLLMTLDRIGCEAEENDAPAGAQPAKIDSNDTDKQSSCRSAASTRASVSRKSSAGSMFFKRQSKVIRPCVSTGGRGCRSHSHCDAALSSIPGSRWADPTPSDPIGTSEHERCASAPQHSAFRDLAKQRAFQRKMSTVVSPTRKGSSAIVQATTHRPSTAAVSSRMYV